MSPSDVLEAVRLMLATWNRPRSLWTFESADLDGNQLLVVFRVDALAPVRPAHDPKTRFGVHYTLIDLPEGPNTGTTCRTPDEWAQELVWDLDEQVATGGVGRADHEPGRDGMVLLRWR